jgi:hypothetical protein
MTQNMKNTIKSLLGVKGGKAVKAEPNPSTMQRPKSVNLDQAPECICGRSIVSLLNIKGGKGKTSTVQTINIPQIGVRGAEDVVPGTTDCVCRKSIFLKK